MAKAALEAMNGLDLYGDNGCSWSVVYVDIDAHNRNRTTLETLLPRESSSKVSSDSLTNPKVFELDLINKISFYTIEELLKVL